MTITNSYQFNCFRDGTPHKREYRETSWQRAMTVALKSGEKWDYVETLSGNKRRYRSEVESPPPQLFGTLAQEMEKQAALQNRAQARLDAPKHSPKINGESEHSPTANEQGRPTMGKEAFNSPMSRRDLRTALKRVAWHLPPEFKRYHVEDEIKERLGGTFTESSMANFMQECIDNGTMIRVRMGWFTLRDGFAIPPQPEPTQIVVAATPPPLQSPPALSAPQLLKNPLDALFSNGFQKSDAPVVPKETAVVSPAPQIDVQSGVLSMMVLGDLVAADTTGDELLLLEVVDALTLLQKQLERLGGLVSKYDKAHQSRSKLLAMLRHEASPGAPTSTTNGSGQHLAA